MLRDLGSHTKSPVPSLKSGKKHTVEGILGTHPECGCPIHAGDQHPGWGMSIRKNSRDKGNHSLKTSYFGLKSPGFMNSPKEWRSSKKTSLLRNGLDVIFL